MKTAFQNKTRALARQQYGHYRIRGTYISTVARTSTFDIRHRYQRMNLFRKEALEESPRTPGPSSLLQRMWRSRASACTPLTWFATWFARFFTTSHEASLYAWWTSACATLQTSRWSVYQWTILGTTIGQATSRGPQYAQAKVVPHLLFRATLLNECVIWQAKRPFVLCWCSDTQTHLRRWD